MKNAEMQQLTKRRLFLVAALTIIGFNVVGVVCFAYSGSIIRFPGIPPFVLIENEFRTIVLKKADYGEEGRCEAEFLGESLFYGNTIKYSAENRVLYKEYWENNKLISGNYFDYDGNKISEIKQGMGIKITLYANGKTEYIACYKNGEVDGFICSFYRNGSIEVYREMAGGNHHGVYCSFFENGKIELKGQSNDGRTIGRWDRYFENGNIKEINYYSGKWEDKADGSYTTFTVDGNKINEWIDSDFNKSGWLIEYDDKGDVRRRRIKIDRSTVSVYEDMKRYIVKDEDKTRHEYVKFLKECLSREEEDDIVPELREILTIVENNENYWEIVTPKPNLDPIQ